MCETLVVTSRREVGRSTVGLGVHLKWGKVGGRNNDRQVSDRMLRREGKCRSLVNILHKVKSQVVKVSTQLLPLETLINNNWYEISHYWTSKTGTLLPTLFISLSSKNVRSFKRFWSQNHKTPTRGASRTSASHSCSVMRGGRGWRARSGQRLRVPPTSTAHITSQLCTCLSGHYLLSEVRNNASHCWRRHEAVADKASSSRPAGSG